MSNKSAPNRRPVQPLARSAPPLPNTTSNRPTIIRSHTGRSLSVGRDVINVDVESFRLLGKSYQSCVRFFHHMWKDTKVLIDPRRILDAHPEDRLLQRRHGFAESVAIGDLEHGVAGHHDFFPGKAFLDQDTERIGCRRIEIGGPGLGRVSLTSTVDMGCSLSENIDCHLGHAPSRACVLICRLGRSVAVAPTSRTGIYNESSSHRSLRHVGCEIRTGAQTPCRPGFPQDGAGR